MQDHIRREDQLVTNMAYAADTAHRNHQSVNPSIKAACDNMHLWCLYSALQLRGQADCVMMTGWTIHSYYVDTDLPFPIKAKHQARY